MQDNKPIAFYSRKLNSAQLNYTTTERELLAIVETLKEFRNILLGQQIIVYTDHKNLTYKVFNTERVMRWRLIVEEYGPELRYLQGHKNIVADALSRLHLAPKLRTENDISVLDEPSSRPMCEAFGISKKHAKNTIAPSIPICYSTILAAQQQDKILQKKVLQPYSKYKLRSFHGAEGKNFQLICYNDKIYVPTTMQQRLVEWYHLMLCHPGEDRMEATIAQHFTFDGLRAMCKRVCSTCDTCQRTKRKTIKYGKLPIKVPEIVPWETLCVDYIGEYKIPRKGKPDLTLQAITMIDPVTGWFEVAPVQYKRSDHIANLVEQYWLTRYPLPQKLIVDRGTEFLAEFSDMMVNDYNVKKRPISTRNPQANAIIERVHQTIGNMVRTYRVQDAEDLDEDNPWGGILAAVAYGVRATIHKTRQASPMQLVFGRDALMPIQHIADWQFVRNRQRKIIQKNNERENASRISHNYCVGDLVLVKQEQQRKYGSDPYLGPYEVTEVRNNGTLRIRMGSITDTWNIRNVHPYRG